jgi:hypothetical protein
MWRKPDLAYACLYAFGRQPEEIGFMLGQTENRA